MQPKLRVRAKLDADGLWEYALRVLGGRSYSTGDLKSKLRAKAELIADVDATIARLKEYGYLNDRQYAEAYAGARLENQGLGKNRVLRDLRGRRVAPAVAEGAISKTYADVDEVALIETYAARRVLRFGSGAKLKDPKELATAYRKLIRAGFSTGNVLRVLKRLAQDPELVDTFEPPQQEE